jgi:hypothetical protein
MRCEQFSDELSTIADGTAALAPDASRHVQQCLRCQAEVAQYRKLLRALSSLRHDVVQPEPDLFDFVLAGLDGAGRAGVRAIVQGRRLVYLGGIAAATAAGAAGYVIASRGRRTLAAG